MATPVDAVNDEPLHGGARGVKRPLQGNPTSVPRNAPAFRGAPGEPGDRVRAPAIETKNRHDRGTNVTVPYSRLVPWDTLRDAGRISPGDVVFTSRMCVGAAHYAPTAAPTRIVGVDWMNRQLGNTTDPATPAPAQWTPGFNVLLGGRSVQKGKVVIYPGDVACDNWRECALLRGWCVDGVVLSNDEPGVYYGSGKHDAQLFNIAVQGVASVNNGYGTRAPARQGLAPRSPTPARRTAQSTSVAAASPSRRRPPHTTTARRTTRSTTTTRCRCSTARCAFCRSSSSASWPQGG